MEKYNILIGFYDPYGGDKFINELINKEYISSVYMAYSELSFEKVRRVNTSNVTYFSRGVGLTADYGLICDLNKLPALSKELLEKMLPYESMIMKMGRRRTHFPTVVYEDEKKIYHRHLRFWNYVFDHHEINLVFMCGEIPHIQYTYVIYGLAKVKGIPVLVNGVTSIPHRVVYGTSIESLGTAIGEYFRISAASLPSESIRLTGDVEEFYEKYSKDSGEVKEERQKSDFAKKQLASTKKFLFGPYYGITGSFRYQKEKARVAAASIIKYHSWSHYRKLRKRLNQTRKDSYLVRYFLKYEAMSLDEYNLIAVEPDYSKKYIYFGLQLTPEATTIPRAGVFAEQYTSVQLLARAAEKNGVLVYVKEHFVQPCRDREVYEILSQIPNVRLIKSSVSSFDLMEHCIAVATQTGTCILEGALKGKPALVTGSGYVWKGLPSLFEIMDEEQGAEVIRSILKGFHVDPDEIKRYFYAIQKCSLHCFWAESPDDVETPMFRENIQERISLLEKFLRQEVCSN